MRKYFAALLFVFVSVPRLAAATPERWIQIRSDHFLIVTNSSEKDARHTAAQFERMRAVFKFLIPTAGSGENSVITVLALKNQKDFQALEPPAYLAKNQLTLDGYFLQTRDKNYILVRLDTQGDQEHPYSTIYHEYTHFLNKNTVWLPLWLNEGLAEFYQNTDINDKEVMLGQPSKDDIYYLRENQLIPLTTLLNVDHSSPYYHDEEKGSVFYAESWALTHYLIINDRVNKTDHLRGYMVNLSKGQDPVAAASAFGDLKRLQNDLDAYVRQGSFSQFKLPRAFPIDEASFKVQPLSMADANTIRADVLFSNGRKPEAVALLDSVLGADPKNAAAHETMGMIKYSEGDEQAARKWLDEAVKLDSQSYLAQFYAAQFALRDHGDPAAIETGLNACIRLNPSFAPAYDELAQLYSRNHDKLAEAHMANVHAIQLDPGNVSYRINASFVLMEEDQPENALNVLKAAEKVARPGELAIVQGRIKDIEQFEAAKSSSTDASTTSANPATPLEMSDVSTTVSVTGGDPDKRTVTTDHGHLARESGAEPHLPDQASGPHHTAKGTISNVKCYAPSKMVVTINNASARPLHLYVNNYFKVDFYTMNFEPKGDLKPCTDIEGLKASINYAEVTPADENIDGQILKVELTK